MSSSRDSSLSPRNLGQSSNYRNGSPHNENYNNYSKYEPQSNALTNLDYSSDSSTSHHEYNYNSQNGVNRIETKSSPQYNGPLYDASDSPSEQEFPDNPHSVGPSGHNSSPIGPTYSHHYSDNSVEFNDATNNHFKTEQSPIHSSPHPQSNEPNQYSSPLPQLPSSSHQEYDKPVAKEEPRKKYDAHPLPTKYEAEPLQKPMENQSSGKASKSSRPPAIPVVHKPSMSREQLKHCRQIIKELKHHRDADPFAAPVDYVAMNLPDYPTIIKKPMDLQTAERKLDNVEYSSIDDFYDDIELIFSNCNLYNGLIAPVSKMAASLQRAFHKLKQQYSKSQNSYNVDDYMDDELPKSSKASKSKPKPSSRRSSASKAAPIKSDVVIPSGKSHVSSKSHSSKANNAAQLKYCNSIIKEFEKKSNYAFIFPFLDPVDPVALNIPDYPKIIKHPMDISSIKKKLSGGRYATAHDFESDVRLMLKNCFTFNPPGTDVYIMGQRVEELFNNKWKSLPVPPPSPAHVQTSSKSYSRPKSMNDGLSSDTSDDEGYPSRDYQPSSAKISKHMKQLSNQIHSLKHSKSRAHESTSISPKKPSHRPKEKAPKQPQSHSSRPKSVPRPETNIDQNDREVSVPISYEEKKVLSDYINFLTPDQLATVVELIKQNMPQLQEAQDEIELDIDTLEPRTLRKLYTFVVENVPNVPEKYKPQKRKSRPQKPPAPQPRKKPRHSSLSSDSSDLSDAPSDGDDTDIHKLKSPIQSKRNKYIEPDTSNFEPQGSPKAPSPVNDEKATSIRPYIIPNVQIKKIKTADKTEPPSRTQSPEPISKTNPGTPSFKSEASYDSQRSKKSSRRRNRDYGAQDNSSRRHLREKHQALRDEEREKRSQYLRNSIDLGLQNRTMAEFEQIVQIDTSFRERNRSAPVPIIQSPNPSVEASPNLSTPLSQSINSFNQSSNSQPPTEPPVEEETVVPHTVQTFGGNPDLEEGELLESET